MRISNFEISYQIDYQALLGKGARAPQESRAVEIEPNPWSIRSLLLYTGAFFWDLILYGRYWKHSIWHFGFHFFVERGKIIMCKFLAKFPKISLTGAWLTSVTNYLKLFTDVSSLITLLHYWKSNTRHHRFIGISKHQEERRASEYFWRNSRCWDSH